MIPWVELGVMYGEEARWGLCFAIVFKQAVLPLPYRDYHGVAVFLIHRQGIVIPNQAIKLFGDPLHFFLHGQISLRSEYTVEHD